MPIGLRTAGVATGPSVAPRDPSTGAQGAGGGSGAAGGGARGLVVTGYEDWVASGQEGVAGVPAGIIDILFQPVQGVGNLLLIDRIVVQTDSTTPTAVAFYKGSVADMNLCEFSGSGDRDLADEFNPVYLPGTTLLIARWTGASALAHAIVRYQYRVATL